MTQKQAVLNYMERFGSISSYEAFADLGITRLAAVIYQIKQDGTPIHCEDETFTNRYGKKSFFTRYSIGKVESL